MEHAQLTGTIIQAAMVVHSELGPGLLESVYERCLELELTSMGLTVARQVEVPVVYKGKSLGFGFRADLVIHETVIIELKAVDLIKEVHKAQVISYMKLMGVPIGLLINFNSTHLRHGIRRFSNRT